MVQKFQVTIDSMAFKGYGVTRIDGKVVFIPYAVVGDKAWIEITEAKKNYSIGKVSHLIEPSPWRVKPSCLWFGQCGGCHWQHIDDSIQSEFKKGILNEALKKIGRLEEVPFITVASSSDPYGYRTRVQLRVIGKTIGYYKEKTHHIVDIDHCPISHPLVNQIILLLRRELPSFPQMEEIEINISPEEEKGVLILPFHSFHQGLEKFLDEFLQLHLVLKGVAIVKKGGWVFLGNSHLNFTIPLSRYGEKRHLRLRTSPESFFQVNLKQNQTLIQTVLNLAELKGDERVLDLYAGVGNLTLPLAIGAKEVLGIEENKMAVEDGRFNTERNRIKNCTFISERVEDILGHWKRGNPDLVVLDPPRMGCKGILNPLVRLRPKKIVYVSCEPTTFSRDLRLFSDNGYYLQRLMLIDMFPQTYHMEVVGLLTPL